MDASVGFLLENLKSLVVYQADLIGNAKKELQKLNEDLGKFQAILVDASGTSKKDEVFMNWEKQIREAVYDIEDTIDTCVTQECATKARNKAFTNRLVGIFKAGNLAEKVRSIRTDTVNPLMAEFEAQKFTDDVPAADTVGADSATTRIRQEKSKHIVGFETETDLFVEKLTQESNKLEITSIIGMPGLGKTTLAWKIFEHQTIEYEFPVRVWVNVSQTFEMRKVLAEILSNVTTTKPDASVSYGELLRQVQNHLAGKHFFIVLDDVWTVDAWTQLKALLPADNKFGRILITTRFTNVGRNPSMQPLEAHNLRLLTDTESWELLQYQVYDKLGAVKEELL